MNTFKDSLGITSYLWYGGGSTHGSIASVDKFKLQRFFVDNFRVTQNNLDFRTEPTWQNFKHDTYLQTLKDNGIKSIWCTQGTFDWYGTQGKPNKVPCLRPGDDPMDPASWADLGELCRQIAIRYAADTAQHIGEARVFTGTPTYLTNIPKAGLDLLEAIEIQNEWDFKHQWSGAEFTLTPEQYAVNFKVCYDAIRSVSNIKIIMGGGISPFITTFQRFLTKLKQLYRDEGKDMPTDFYLCFHWYMRNGSADQGGGTSGITPEDANAYEFGLSMDELCREYGLPGWYCTETGWATDSSKQQAPALEGFTKEQAQGILMVRLALIWAACEFHKGISFWHCRDDYDLPPYAKGGINYKNWSAKPARTICEDYLGNYADHTVLSFGKITDDTYFAVLKNGTESVTLGWSNKVNSNGLSPKPNITNIVIPIPGCTDPNATNYNPDATVDDGTCKYPTSLPKVNAGFNPIEVDLVVNGKKIK